MVVDAAIIAFTGFFTWRGYRRGLLSSISKFIGFIAATAAAVFGYRTVSSPLRGGGMSEGTAHIVAALLIFVVVSVLFFFGGRAITKLLDITKWGMLNHAGGAAIAALWSVALVTAVLLFMTVTPSQALNARVEDSTLGRSLVREAPAFALGFAESRLRPFVTSFWDRPTQIAATTDFRVAPIAERELLDRLNAERRRHGLRALRWDDGLTRAARAHVADMYRRGYFSHDSPEGLTPGDRLRRARVAFRLTAENLALALTIPSGNDELFRSKTHRAHLMSKEFTRIGIGVMYGRQGYLIAQEFAA